MRILAYIVIAFMLVSAAPLSEKVQTDTNAKIKAVFLYNFTKYIEWPKSYKDGNFIIGVLGNSPIYPELNSMASSKTVGSQKMEIKMFTSVGNISKCHMLYVPGNSVSGINDVLPKLKGNSTLLITEKPGLVKQGAAINFVVMDNKQKFELSKSNAEKYDLIVGANLLALAIVVD
jgi:hypothetical protein